MKLFPRAVLTIVSLLAGQPLRSNVFADIASSLHQQHESIGKGIGRALGVKLGGALETATAPALDNAATRFTEVVKTAAGTLDQSLQAENESIDTIARRNIDHVNSLTQVTLNEVDQLADARLQQVNADAVNLLDREATIVDDALKQENNIANNALDRVEAISGQSLSRLQDIEGDAFDRVDSALQDQVPVAASQVAHEFVVAGIVVVCIVALFGFAAISLWKNFQQARDADSSMGQILKSGFLSFWRTLPQEAAVVVFPTLLVGAVILGAYEGYLRTTQATRVSRLQKAASLLEKSGEYKLAAQLRKRVVDVSGESNSASKEFAYQADVWLADFIQKKPLDLNDLTKRLTLLESSGLVQAAPDLQAASLYFRASIFGDFDDARANRFNQQFLDGKSAPQVPILGKLVLMTQIKAALDREASANERVTVATKLTQQLRELYPNYANGHILAAWLLSAQADALDNCEQRNPNRGAALRQQAAAELSRASRLDPDTSRFVSLNNAELPADLLKDLNENPRTPGLASRLGKYASMDIDPIARAILVSDVLTHQAVDRILLRAIRRGMGERNISRAIAELPENPEQRAAAMLSIAQQSLAINSYLPAEAWLDSVQKTAAASDPGLKQRIACLRQAIIHSKMSSDLAAVI